VTILQWLKKIILRIFGYVEVYEEKSVRLRVIGKKETMTAFEFLKHIKKNGYYLPMSTEMPCTEASNAEIKRWLKSSSVVINSKKPNVNDEIEFPVTELAFFPKGKRKTTFF